MENEVFVMFNAMTDAIRRIATSMEHIQDTLEEMKVLAGESSIEIVEQLKEIDNSFAIFGEINSSIKKS